ncbi:hypothetical protein, partial [Thiolapillus sp.]|uniref:hypothetical protein n=1 Tax=Thiolapillus sp. TaxID=2017437 RepID=UPI003AF496F9
PHRAFAPAEVLFVPDIPAGLSIVQADWDFDGDGVADSTLTMHPSPTTTALPACISPVSH